MSSTVFAAVILAALLHAAWNALLKSETDKLAGGVGVSIGGVPLALAGIAVAGFPPLAAWPYVLASAVIHTFYYLCLLNAYRAADFTQVYPVARGIAPVLTACFGVIMLGEVLTPLQTAAVVIIGSGVTSLVFAGRSDRNLTGAGLAYALATGVLIATYSLNDGAGAREAGSSLSFYGTSSILNCALLCLYVRIARPGTLCACFTRARSSTLVGGPVSFVAYAIVTWAFSQAPIATVSALREVSVAFAILIGTFVLKERMNWRKIASTFVTLTGAILLRAAR
ncbi:DMT family transporter [Mangrovicella endophytica]|uniref:DMT family transporter n=1 Tax=Mangrovicella endophytica TaxID=2066697 RepID=UPI000C9DD3F1|nr:DMT family transporter [Mangrovicella endophytica]